MKVPKQITVDFEIASLLSKENNASALVNALLVDYYDTHGQQIEKKNGSVAKREIRNQQEDASFSSISTTKGSKRSKIDTVNEGKQDSGAEAARIDRERDRETHEMGIEFLDSPDAIEGWPHG